MEIKLLVERLDGGRAFLKDEKGRLIIWPRDFLPTDAEEGKNVSLNTSHGEVAQKGRQAKDILNEILLS